MANETSKAALFDVSAVVLISYGAIVLPLPLADATGKLFAMSCILTGITYTITPAYLLTPRRKPAKKTVETKLPEPMTYEDDVIHIPVKKAAKKRTTTKATKKRVATKKTTTRSTATKRRTAKKKTAKA